MNRAIVWIGVVTGIAVAVAGCGSDDPQQTTHAAPAAHTPPQTPAELYSAYCEVCHGASGAGDGDAAYLLDPKPRNFRLAQFRLISTDNGVPTEQDLARTIERGMPGTPMPPWPQLSEAQRLELARYVLGLAREGLIEKAMARGATRQDAETAAARKLQPGAVIAAQPPAAEYSADELRASFVELCATCHAEDGTGRDDPAWRTAEGHPLRSRNFAGGVFKGGRDPVDLYRRIAAGMPGSPMPGFAAIPPDQIWRMVRYIESLSDPAAQERAWVRSQRLEARAGGIPTAFDGWDALPATELALLPLWSDARAVTHVSVRAAYDAERIAVMLEWSDPEPDAGAGVADFSDGAAVQWSTAADPPLFAMGDPGREIRLWHWRAQWTEPAQAAPAVADGRSTADVFYADQHGWTWGTNIADDGAFLTAAAADNAIAAAPAAGGMELSARRFGTLEARRGDGRQVAVTAAWSGGRWRAVFVGPRAVEGAPVADGAELSVAFAVWNGQADDRNGKKSVTIWQRLVLAGGAR